MMEQGFSNDIYVWIGVSTVILAIFVGALIHSLLPKPVPVEAKRPKASDR